MGEFKPLVNSERAPADEGKKSIDEALKEITIPNSYQAPEDMFADELRKKIEEKNAKDAEENAEERQVEEGSENNDRKN